MERGTTLMMVGLGDLGGLVLNHLVQRPRFGRIFLAGRNAEALRERRDLALLFAAQLGYYHDIDCVALDLTDADRTAETLAELKPDLVFNAASLLSPRLLARLPDHLSAHLEEARFGPWLPLHLAPAYKLMTAVKASGHAPIVVNAAFPDAVGPVLAAAGLAPDVGIGSAANIVPVLRGAVGMTLGLPTERVEIALIAHRYIGSRLPAFGDAGGAPYRLFAYVGGEEVGYEKAKVLSLVKTAFKRTDGDFGRLVAAASALSVLLPLIEGREAIVHAPAPGGLPGGYRVRIAEGKIEPALPAGLDLAEAIRVNEEGQKFDGIESIGVDGTVRFRSAQMAIMRDGLGYFCPTLRLEEAEPRARELRAKFLELAASRGVTP